MKFAFVTPKKRLHLGNWFSAVRPFKRDGATLVCCDLQREFPSDDEAEITMATLASLGSPARLESNSFDRNRLIDLMSFVTVSELIPFRIDSASVLALNRPVILANTLIPYASAIIGRKHAESFGMAIKIVNRYRQASDTGGLFPPVTLVRSVRDLAKPDLMMSAENPQGCLFLDDSVDSIRTKVMRASTCEEGLANLKWLYTEFIGPEDVDDQVVLKARVVEYLDHEFKPCRKLKLKRKGFARKATRALEQ